MAQRAAERTPIAVYDAVLRFLFRAAAFPPDCMSYGDTVPFVTIAAASVS